MGESAAGKATFIQYAVANPDCELLQQLGYHNHKIIPVKESFYLEDFDRIAIKDIVLDLLHRQENAVILIKWQATDSLHEKYGNVLRKLAFETPDIPNEIVFLSVTSSVLYERVQKKPWWNDPDIPHSYYSQEQMDRSIERMRSHISELLELGFSLTDIDATNGYRLIENTL